MAALKIGDIVGRKSYGGDILFKVVDVCSSDKGNICTLKGITYRIEADAPESDLVVQSDQKVREYTREIGNAVDKKLRKIKQQHRDDKLKKGLNRATPNDEGMMYYKPGKILHLDGDPDYLESCMKKYEEFGIVAVGKYVPEKDQASQIYRLLQEHKPDILVLTGHDGVIKNGKDYSSIENYRNSKYFINAVKEARKYERSMDDLVIFAGACQSLYRDIIEAGANFASAPFRVLIHAYDPVMVCRKIAFTDTDQMIDAKDVIEDTITGYKGIGGVKTRGKYRVGFPAEPY